MVFQSPGSVAFHFGTITVYWYGIMLAVAFLIGVAFTSIIAKKQGENPDNVMNLAIFLLFGAILGARFYYVIFNWDFYRMHLEEILMTWHGGLSIHGAIIGGFISGAVYTRINNLPLLKYADLVSYGLILGQAIGRWGNFFNAEAFGLPTNLPWKLYISQENRPEKYIDYQYFHPAFLYESLWNILVFCILYFILRKKFEGNNGVIFFSYLILYSIGRIFIESIRIDSIFMIYGVSIAQIASFIFILTGISGLYFVNKILKSARQ
jgi:phosphatidylglycerol:prolipoprotein diacylglycerol transferase